MFKFLKEKLNNVVKKFSKEVQEESEIIEVKEKIEQKSEILEQVDNESKNKQKNKLEQKIFEQKKDENKNDFKNEKKYQEQKNKHLDIKKEKTSTTEPDQFSDNSQKKGFFSKIFSGKEKEIKKPIYEKQEITKEEKNTIITKKQNENIKEKPELEKLDQTVKSEQEVEQKSEKKGFFGKVSDVFTKIQLSEQKFDELFWDIEIILLENNVAVEVIEVIKKDLKEELTKGKISRKNVQEIITETLKQSLDKVLSMKKINLEEEIKNKKPYIITVIGVNGSGKTTAVAKLANFLQKKGFSVVIAAADTFRAAAIHQIEEHANKLGIKIIKHDYNSDPSAVAFDAIKHAQSKNIDVVLIDTAGRMHSNDNLMQELKKLIRVNKPDLKLFVGESITGNDCVEQAKKYNEEIGIDAILLTKADVDEKGGTAISISHVIGKPIIFMGTGQAYDDLEPFNKEKIIESLEL